MRVHGQAAAIHGQASSRQESTPIFLRAELARIARVRHVMSRLPRPVAATSRGISPLLSMIAVGCSTADRADGDSYTSAFLDQVARHLFEDAP